MKKNSKKRKPQNEINSLNTVKRNKKVKNFNFFLLNL